LYRQKKNQEKLVKGSALNNPVMVSFHPLFFAMRLSNNYLETSD